MNADKPNTPGDPTDAPACAPANPCAECRGGASFDAHSLWERVNQDIALLRDLVTIFSSEYPGILLQIETAIDLRNPIELQKYSHKLKGSLLQFSAKRAAGAARTLEEMGRTAAMSEALQVFAQLQVEVVSLVQALNLMLYQGTPQ